MIMQNLENTETEIQILNIGIEEQKTLSIKRFIFLSIISFGLYPIWWIFEAWRFFMQKDKLDIMPAMRTILTYFFIYSLFNKIQSAAKILDCIWDCFLDFDFNGFIYFRNATIDLCLLWRLNHRVCY